MRRLLFLLAALAAGCDSSADRTAYTLTLLDEGGAVVATGRLDFDAPLVRGASVGGTYRLNRPDLTLNQTGGLRASCTDDPGIRESVLAVQLDTDVSDAGLALYGWCEGGPTGGTWSRVTIAGDAPAGTFKIE